MTRTRFAFAFLTSTCLAVSALAWDANAHKVVATIAYDTLKSTRPDVQAWADSVIAGNEAGYNTFVDSATYADWLKRSAPNGWPPITHDGRFTQWHFIDYPIYDDQVAVGTPVPPVKVATNSLIYGLPLLENSSYGLPAGKNLALIIHLVGDAHQPLHCATWCTSHAASAWKGDTGGNDFALTYKAGAIRITELHDLWDKAISIKYGLVTEHESDAMLAGVATQIEGNCPISSFGGKEKDLDLVDWTLESYERAFNQAYRPHDPATILADPYIANMEDTAEKRVALAGYRLANLLIAIHDHALPGTTKKKKKKGQG